MRIVVTGADGLLGLGFLRLAGQRHDCVGLTHRVLDVADREAVARQMPALEPEVIVHCAAYTDVDGAERNPALAMTVNGDGTEWVARAARATGALMVYVSSDYVFDGQKSSPYVESDEVRPLSRYGLSKLSGERRVEAISPDQHLIVRTAWLYGEGKGFVDWVLARLDRGDDLPLVSDQEGSPTYSLDLAEALLRLVENAQRGCFHFTNRGAASWLGLGRAVLELSGRTDAIWRAVQASDLKRPAARPRCAVLAVDKYEGLFKRRVPDWRDGLKRYLRARGYLAR